MKRIILVILAIFSITMTVDAQSVSIINKTMSFTKKVDGILTADGRRIDVEWPNTAYVTIDIKDFGSVGNIVTMTLYANDMEMVNKVFSDVDVIVYKKDNKSNYFIKDDIFNYGGLFYDDNKFICSLYTVEIN